MGFHRGLSSSTSKDKARQAVLDFLPEKVEKIISLPAEFFAFEAIVKFRYPDAKIYAYEREKSVIQKNMHSRYFFIEHLLYDYCHSDVFKSNLEDVDFAWLDLCSIPSIEIQKDFIKLAHTAKPGSRVVITLTRRVRNIKNKDYRSLSTIERFIHLVQDFTKGKVLDRYDYINKNSPMSMLFIQF